MDLAVFDDKLGHTGVMLNLDAELLGAGGQGVPQKTETHLLTVAGKPAHAGVRALDVGPLGVEESGLAGLNALACEPVDVLAQVLSPALDVLLVNLVQAVQVCLVGNGTVDARGAENNLRRHTGVAALETVGCGLEQKRGAQTLVGGCDGGGDARATAAHDDDISLGVPSRLRLVGNSSPNTSRACNGGGRGPDHKVPTRDGLVHVSPP